MAGLQDLRELMRPTVVRIDQQPLRNVAFAVVIAGRALGQEGARQLRLVQQNLQPVIDASVVASRRLKPFDSMYLRRLTMCVDCSESIWVKFTRMPFWLRPNVK